MLWDEGRRCRKSDRRDEGEGELKKDMASGVAVMTPDVPTSGNENMRKGNVSIACCHSAL